MNQSNTVTEGDDIKSHAKEYKLCLACDIHLFSRTGHLDILN